jgi:hypothetical protein
MNGGESQGCHGRCSLITLAFRVSTLIALKSFEDRNLEHLMGIFFRRGSCYTLTSQ